MAKDVQPDGKVVENLDVREVLDKFGRYQVLQYLLACLPTLFVTMININYVVVAGDLDYRCRIPECEGVEPTVPSAWWPNGTDRCSRPVLYDGFALGNESCSLASFTDSVVECTDWVYESNNSIVGELDLACQPWKVNLIGTIHNIGTLFSTIIAGWISDRFGRKPALIICAVGSFVGLLKTYATSYYFFVVVEFLESFLSGGIYPATTVLMIEISGKNRILAGIVFAYVIYCGELLFACLAMVVSYWKNLIRIINTPAILFLFYLFILRESPRWHILNNKTDQAKKTIRKAAKINNININTDQLDALTDDQLKDTFSIEKNTKREGFKEFFTSKEIMKRLLVSSVCRFSTGFVYYGLIINSVSLPGDKYTNFLLLTVMSFPGELLAYYLMNRVGRKLPLMFGYLFCGMACVGSAYCEIEWLKITFFLLGKMIISACYTGIVTFTMELFPTSIRGSLLGLGSFMSRSGALLAPLTPLLASIYPALPTICFGGSGLLSGLILTLAPETRDLPLMDTIAQVSGAASQRGMAKTDKNASCETVVTKI